MSQRYSRKDMGMTVKEDKALQRNSFARRHLDANLEAQQSVEKIHLQTIRNEKMRLQKELEKMRGRGHQRILGRRHTASMSNNTARLTHLRLTKEPNERFQGQGLSQSFNGGNRSLKISARSTSPVPGATGEPNTARAPMEAVGRGRHTVELPSIIPGGRSPRSGYHNRQESGEDYIREQQMMEHKRNLNKKQEELQARMDKFGDDLGQKHSNGDARRSPSDRSDTKSEDGITVSSDPSASFPPPSQPQITETPFSSRQRSNSFSEYDLKSVKNSITKRLVGDEKTPAESSNDAPTTENPQLNRTTSQLTTSTVTGNAKLRKKKSSVGSDSKPKGMPSNLDMVFDQDTYAPDGSLRTMHMLPDPMETFEEAKKARYLRWRGPQEDDIELTVNQIFGKAESSLGRKESSSSLLQQNKM